MARKCKERKGFLRRPRKTWAQGASRARHTGGVRKTEPVRNFPTQQLHWIDGGERSCPNTAHFTDRRYASSLNTATFATC
jgi:hypothetical protein